MAEQQRRQEEWMVVQLNRKHSESYGKDLDATRREEGLPWRRPQSMVDVSRKQVIPIAQ